MAGSNKLTSPVEYVDNYDKMADERTIHPRVRNQMEPMIDTMERSQNMRGARDLGGVDPWEEIAMAAAKRGYRMPDDPSMEDMEEMLYAASEDESMGGDQGIDLLQRAAKTLGMSMDFSSKPPQPGGPVGPAADEGATPWPAVKNNAAHDQYASGPGRIRQIERPPLRRNSLTDGPR
jgi:hypothetical protein